jgi:predicted small metal-binding protein
LLAFATRAAHDPFRAKASRPRGGTDGAASPSRLTEDTTMTRKYIDCRLFPSDSKCSIAICGDTEDEIVEAAAQHAVAVHKHDDSPQLRQHIRASIKEGTPQP